MSQSAHRVAVPIVIVILSVLAVPVMAQSIWAAAPEAPSVNPAVQADRNGLALAYATYLGGSEMDWGRHVAVDEDGNVYVVGQTTSPDFPVTAGAYETEFALGNDAFVAKFKSDGSGLAYATFLNGDSATAIAVDGQGNAYVGGSGGGFPITEGSFGDEGTACVMKLDATGSNLLFGGCLPGVNAAVHDIAVDDKGQAYISGAVAASFPTTPGAYSEETNGGFDPFIAIISPDGSSVVYATYLGGSGHECSWVGHEGRGCTLDIDSGGNVYVTGGTLSPDLPVSAGAFDASCGTDGACNRDWDAFVVKLNPAGRGEADLVYATYLGGSGGEMTSGIAVDPTGSVYVAGSVHSADYPTTPGALARDHNGGHFDAFVTKLNSEGSDLIYSTYLGGGGNEKGWDIAIDDLGRAHAIGQTTSGDFPATPNALASTSRGADAFVVRLSGQGDALEYATYLGGSDVECHKSGAIAVHADGGVSVTGETTSQDFPTLAGAFSSRLSGRQDLFAASFAIGVDTEPVPDTIVPPTATPAPGAPPTSVPPSAEPPTATPGTGDEKGGGLCPCPGVLGMVSIAGVAAVIGRSRRPTQG